MLPGRAAAGFTVTLNGAMFDDGYVTLLLTFAIASITRRAVPALAVVDPKFAAPATLAVEDAAAFRVSKVKVFASAAVITNAPLN